MKYLSSIILFMLLFIVTTCKLSLIYKSTDTRIIDDDDMIDVNTSANSTNDNVDYMEKLDSMDRSNALDSIK